MAKYGVKRKALTEANWSYYRWRFLGNYRRTLRALLAGRSYSDAPRIARQIAENGIVVGPSDHYLSNAGRGALMKASELVMDLSRNSDVQATLERGRCEREGSTKDYLVWIIPTDQPLSPDSPLVKLALDKKLLEIVSCYLGLWPRLHSISAPLNFPTTDAPKASQLWHRDPEDIRQIKVFIYLTDVDEGCGPFCYIPGTQPFGRLSARVPHTPKGVKERGTNKQSDDDIAEVLPRELWLTCLGPTNTMILADTVGFHRGGNATTGTRILITFTYTSGAPLTRTRKLRITGEPEWIRHDIQRYALMT